MNLFISFGQMKTFPQQQNLKVTCPVPVQTAQRKINFPSNRLWFSIPFLLTEFQGRTTHVTDSPAVLGPSAGKRDTLFSLGILGNSQFTSFINSEPCGLTLYFYQLPLSQKLLNAGAAQSQGENDLNKK